MSTDLSSNSPFIGCVLSPARWNDAPLSQAAARHPKACVEFGSLSTGVPHV